MVKSGCGRNKDDIVLVISHGRLAIFRKNPNHVKRDGADTDPCPHRILPGKKLIHNRLPQDRNEGLLLFAAGYDFFPSPASAERLIERDEFDGHDLVALGERIFG